MKAGWFHRTRVHRERWGATGLHDHATAPLQTSTSDTFIARLGGNISATHQPAAPVTRFKA